MEKLLIPSKKTSSPVPSFDTSLLSFPECVMTCAPDMLSLVEYPLNVLFEEFTSGRLPHGDMSTLYLETVR